MTACFFLAVRFGIPAAVAFAEAGNWRGVFTLQVGAAAVACVFMARALPASLGVGAPATTPWRVLREPMVAPALLSVMLYTGAFFTTVQFVGAWLDESSILPRANQGWLWIGLGLTSAVGSIGLGRVADRVGKLNYVLWTTAIMAICLVLLGRVRGIPALLAVGVPLAAFSASRSAALLALLSEIVEPRMRGTLMGIRAAAVYVGMGVFSSLGGYIYQEYDYHTLLMTGAAAMVAAYVLLRLFVREVR